MEIKTKNNITYCRIPKREIKEIDFVHCNEPKQTIESFVRSQAQKPDVVINGGFFALNNGNTVFDYIDNYKIISSDPAYSFGMGITPEGQLKYGTDTETWKDFITAYPPLMKDGYQVATNIGSEINGKFRRSVLGYNVDNVYLIVFDNPGATYNDIVKFLKEIGVTHAINLDGGGSTRLWYHDQVFAAASYNRPVDNVIAVYLQDTKLYRVQLGAFSSKTNATNYCKQIKTLGDWYKDAYVRYVEPYYKVQVGAFSIKANAEKLVKDLKSKGYNAFITV